MKCINFPVIMLDLGWVFTKLQEEGLITKEHIVTCAHLNFKLTPTLHFIT